MQGPAPPRHPPSLPRLPDVAVTASHLAPRPLQPHRRAPSAELQEKQSRGWVVSPHSASRHRFRGLCHPPKAREGLGHPEPPSLGTDLPAIPTFVAQHECRHGLVGAACLHLEGSGWPGQWRSLWRPLNWGPLGTGGSPGGFAGLTWLYVQFFFLHLPHWKRSVTVPPVLAIWCSRMASWVMAFLSSFSSSLAISCHRHRPGRVSTAVALPGGSQPSRRRVQATVVHHPSHPLQDQD